MFAAHQQFATDRFERQLTGEIAGMRQDMHRELAGVRQDMLRMEARLLRWTLGIWMAQLAFEAALIVGVVAYVAG